MNFRNSTRLLVFTIALVCRFGAAQEMTVAAAADLQSAMPDVANRFQKESGETVRVIYSSSGNFFQRQRHPLRYVLLGESRLPEETGGCGPDATR